MMRSIKEQKGINRIITLTNILDLLGKVRNSKELSTKKTSSIVTKPFNHDILNELYTYLTFNYKEEISLPDIANHLGLNPTSLCRLFKKRTNKTIFQCLNEIRIEHACKLLHNYGLSVSLIAYESGFNNLSHFNKQFRIITKQSPSEYRESINIESVIPN